MIVFGCVMCCFIVTFSVHSTPYSDRVGERLIEEVIFWAFLKTSHYISFQFQHTIMATHEQEMDQLINSTMSNIFSNFLAVSNLLTTL